MSFRGDWSLEKIRTQVQVERTANAKPTGDGMSK